MMEKTDWKLITERAQPEVNFITTKLSRTIGVGQKQFLPIIGGKLSGTNDVRQFGRTLRQQFPDQETKTASNSREDFYIKSSVPMPKLKLAEFSEDPVECPEWLQLFQAKIRAANEDNSLKMYYVIPMVMGKVKEAISGLRYTAEMYIVAWTVLDRNFGKSQMVVKAQLRRIYSFQPIKYYDGIALIKYARIVSSRVNFLTQLNYVGDLNSEGVLESATRKLPFDMKSNCLAYVKQMNMYQPGLAVFSEWLNDLAFV